MTPSQRGNSSSASLDELYLEFLDKTAAVFHQYSQLEALRYFLFRELLIQKRVRTWSDIAKHWFRPIVHPKGPIKKPPKADVVLLIEGLREVVIDALLPVFHELRTQGVDVLLVGAGGARGLPAKTHYFQSPTYVLAPAWAQTAWNVLNECLDLGGSRPLARSFKDHCCNVQGIFEGLERMLDIVDPRIVLVASTQLPTGASLVVESKKRSILSLVMQHGVLQPLYLPMIADRMINWGQSSVQSLSALGVAQSQLIPLGSPRHDRMVSAFESGSQALLCSALDLPKQPTFVFFSNGNDELRNGSAPRECADWLEAMAAQYRNDINVVVRLHPNEDGRLYRDRSYLCVTKNEPNLAITLTGCDWVGSLCSTVLYDALLFHKPVWQFHAEGWPELADNWRQGLALRISSQHDLQQKVQTLLSGWGRPAPDRPTVEQAFANQGHAAQAVAEYIRSCVEANRSASGG